MQKQQLKQPRNSDRTPLWLTVVGFTTVKGSRMIPVIYAVSVHACFTDDAPLGDIQVPEEFGFHSVSPGSGLSFDLFHYTDAAALHRGCAQHSRHFLHARATSRMDTGVLLLRLDALHFSPASTDFKAAKSSVGEPD